VPSPVQTRDVRALALGIRSHVVDRAAFGSNNPPIERRWIADIAVLPGHISIDD
jgi:hypothetical protein